MSRRKPTLDRRDPDNDYRLIADDCWIAAGAITINIRQNAEGVVVDVWPKGREAEVTGSLASCWATFAEAEES